VLLTIHQKKLQKILIMVLLSLLAFFILFSFLIIIHEFGHYYAAIKSGVKVEEFGLGMGKKIFGKKIGETEYTFNLIPFGGFVRMLGEDEAVDDPRSFEKAALWKRMGITLAGVFMNFVFGVLALSVLFTIGTDPILISKQDYQHAYETGILQIEKADGTVITKEEALKLGDSEKIKVTVTEKTQLPYPQALAHAFSETYRISIAILQKVAEIPGEIANNQKLPDGLTGPVGIAEVTHKILPQGFAALIKLAALLSISLGVMNLLPIPALDGGRFFFQLIELGCKPFRFRPPLKWEEYAHVGGFVLLMGFLLAVTWQDITRIFF
jgi:regulator of sigma E protease